MKVKRRGDWRQVLTRGEKRHLREANIHTKGALLRTVTATLLSPFPCWECRSIAHKVGII